MKMDESAFMKRVAGQLGVERWRQAVFDMESAEETALEMVCAKDYDKALAGYAARDARIAELEARVTELEQALKFANVTMNVVLQAEALSGVARRGLLSEVSRIDALMCAKARAKAGEC
jgi:hypothetical protein